MMMAKWIPHRYSFLRDNDTSHLSLFIILWLLNQEQLLVCVKVNQTHIVCMKHRYSDPSYLFWHPGYTSAVLLKPHWAITEFVLFEETETTQRMCECECVVVFPVHPHPVVKLWGELGLESTNGPFTVVPLYKNLCHQRCTVPQLLKVMELKKG